MICNCRLIINYKLLKRHLKAKPHSTSLFTSAELWSTFQIALSNLPPSCSLFILVLEGSVKLICLGLGPTAYGLRERSIFCFRKPTPNAVGFNSCDMRNVV